MMSILYAVVGTIALSVLFGVPARYYPYCGLIGGAGWAVYVFAQNWCGEGSSALLAAMLVLLLSRFTAIWKRCPVTVFLISGIFPLVPGAGLYWTAYYIVTNQPQLAAQNGYQAVKIAAAIVLGIVFVFELPQGIFLRLLGRGDGKETQEQRQAR